MHGWNYSYLHFIDKELVTRRLRTFVYDGTRLQTQLCSTPDPADIITYYMRGSFSTQGEGQVPWFGIWHPNPPASFPIALSLPPHAPAEFPLISHWRPYLHTFKTRALWTQHFSCRNAILSHESKFWNEFINFKNHIYIYTHTYHYMYINLLYIIHNKNQTEGFLRCHSGQHWIL